MDKFTVEEINLMCVYETADRTELISEIKSSLPHISDPELIELMEIVIEKLEHTTDGEYATLSFSSADELDEQEN